MLLAWCHQFEAESLPPPPPQEIGGNGRGLDLVGVLDITEKVQTNRMGPSSG